MLVHHAPPACKLLNFSFLLLLLWSSGSHGRTVLRVPKEICQREFEKMSADAFDISESDIKKREFLDEAKTEKLVQPIFDGQTHFTEVYDTLRLPAPHSLVFDEVFSVQIKLGTKSFDVPAAHVMARAIKKLQVKYGCAPLSDRLRLQHLRVANLADCIAGRPEAEALEVYAQWRITIASVDVNAMVLGTQSALRALGRQAARGQSSLLAKWPLTRCCRKLISVTMPLGKRYVRSRTRHR